ncbi:RepB family plasmid replication initiator protein [Vibrio parahaemolyticus]|nr:RepB family plasmid replication initiator protein [Vibrio parahaemolyticus]
MSKTDKNKSLSNYHFEDTSQFRTSKNPIVKLKNDLIESNITLAKGASVTKLNLYFIYYIMSLYDAESYLSGPDVYSVLHNRDENGVFAEIKNWVGIENKELIKDTCRLKETRSVLIDGSKLNALIVGDDKKTKNYDKLRKVINEIEDAKVYTRKKDSKGRITDESISVFERTFTDYDPTTNKIKAVFTFSESFMPYVLAFTQYEGLELNVIKELDSVFAIRYYHWFLSLKKDKRNNFEIRVSEIRERFNIQEKYKDKFMQRVVHEPLDELAKASGLHVKGYPIRDESAKGRPLVRVRFVMSDKPIVDDEFADELTKLLDNKRSLVSAIKALPAEASFLEEQLKEQIEAINSKIKKIRKE